MEEEKSFKERAMDIVRSGPSPERKRKRRISRGIMIADAVIILLVCVFMVSRQQNESVYRSASASVSGLHAVLSEELKNGSYVFSLTFSSGGKAAGSWQLTGSAAVLNLRHKGNIFYTDVISPGLNSIDLLPGEAKTFPVEVDSVLIDSWFSGLKIKNVKKSLFDFTEKGEPVTAEAVLSLKEPVSFSLEFRHEVKE